MYAYMSVYVVAASASRPQSKPLKSKPLNPENLKVNTGAKLSTS